MKKIQLLFVLFLGCNATIRAQQSAVVSGGNASGAAGTMSYSVGQIVYTSNVSNATGTLDQGVQQPFEIQTVLGIEIPQISLIFSAYPNPTDGLLTLDVGDFDFSKTLFQLFDLNGRLIIDKKITDSKTKIAMDKYPQATYLLNVLDNNKIIKTFKIIKNQ